MTDILPEAVFCFPFNHADLFTWLKEFFKNLTKLLIIVHQHNLKSFH